MATAITKAQLETALAAAQARISELEAALAAKPAEDGRRDQLEQTLWLQRNHPKHYGRFEDGTAWVQFGAQYARRNKEGTEAFKDDGPRTFGGYKNFIAYGDIAEAVLNAFGDESRLARICAYEKPWHGKPDASGYPTRNTEWAVTGFTLVQRVTPAAPAAAPAQPQLAQVAF
jgi:hypothetical protein